MIIQQFKGIHNTVPVRSIPDDALSDAVDVDIDDSGAVIKRDGYAQSVVMSIDNAYSTLEGEAFITSGGLLYRLDNSLNAIEISSTEATEFCDYGEILFTNDGLMVRGNEATDLTLSTPGIAPTLTVVTGELPAGTYHATYTVKNSFGMESVAAPISSITIEDNQDIIVTPPINGVSYLTDADGTVYYTASGMQLDPILLGADKFPSNVDKIEFWDSRLWCSVQVDGETIIFYSKPFHYHVFDYESNYIPIPGKVLVLARTNDGLLIGTQSSIFLYNESLVKLSDYGVIPGRSVVKMPNGNVLIHTERGVCTLPFQNLTEAKVSLPMGSLCSTAIIYQNGIQKYIALHDGGNSFNKA